MAKVSKEGKKINDLLYLQKLISELINSEISEILHGKGNSGEQIKERLDYIIKERIDFYDK